MTSSNQARPGTIALAGIAALAVAMGIGRFAFTPLLPMMLHDGVIDLRGASWLASLNYLGYLAGALLCTFQPWLWARLGRTSAIEPTHATRVGLTATAVLTLAMAWPLAAAWPLWRFASGVASAMVFVFTSGWCMARLAGMNHAALGGAIFVGPGAGIVLSGLAAGAMTHVGWTAQWAWCVMAALAAALVVGVWPVFAPPSLKEARAGARGPGAVPSVATRASSRATTAEISGLAIAYGLAGFGYIVTATFLPVIARQALPGSPWLDLFWPVFGVGVMIGPLVATRVGVSIDRRLLLAGGHAMQALGILVGIWSPSLAGFALGSLLLGIPFTAITFFAMQETRRLKPLQVTSFIGLMTALYGIGQIAGPPMVAQVLRHSASTGAGFTLALEIAAAGLLLGAAIYLALRQRWPLPPPPSRTGPG